MLSLDSIQAAENLARDVNEMNMRLVPQAATPLAELAGTSVLGTGIVRDLSDTSGALQQISIQSDNNEHNERVDYFVQQQAEAAGRHMDYARNVVLAAVRAVCDDLVSMGAVAKADPVSEFCLKVKNTPRPLQQDAFVSSLDREVNGSYIEPESTFRFGERGPLAVLELMATGAQQFDDEVKLWAAEVEDSFLLHVWDNAFRSVVDSQPTKVATVLEMMNDRDTGPDAAIAILLITRHISENTPEDSNMEPDLYKELCKQYRDVAAQTLLKALEKEQQAINRGEIYISRDARTKTITVRGEVYRTWLRTGGKPEILFALLIKERSENNIAAIDPLREQMQKEWTSFANVARVRYANEELARFRDNLSIAFYRDLRKAGELELEYQRENPGHIDRVHRAFEDEIEMISLGDTRDLLRLVTRVVARARFYYTDAYKIVKAIDTACMADETLSVEEAVRAASMEYIADFICDQICFVAG